MNLYVFLFCFITSSTEDAEELERRLCKAVLHHDIDTVQSLIESGVDVNIPTARLSGSVFHDIPLFIAVMRCNKEMLNILMDAGANVDIKAQCTGCTPLLSAATCDNGEGIVEHLIWLGADMNAASSDGKTVLYRALYNKCMTSQLRYEVHSMTVLFQHGANDMQMVLELSTDWTSSYFFGEVTRFGVLGSLRESWFSQLLQLIRLSGNRDKHYRKCLKPLLFSKMSKMCRNLVQESVQKILTLQECCRVSIRRQLCQVSKGRSIYDKIELLDLPRQLKQYIKMEEFLPTQQG